MPEPVAPFKITICGIHELSSHCKAGISHVLSILDPDWAVPDAFAAFGEHEKLELRFHDVIEEEDAEYEPPQDAHVADILAFGRDLVEHSRGNEHLLVHCHAGVSRSTASVALILAQALPQMPANRVFEEVLRVRPQAWPNLRMLELGDAMLDRHGDLVAAAAGLYRTQLARQKYLADQMRAGGRWREVEIAQG